MIKKQKEVYTSPTTDLLVVRFEHEILGVSGGANYAPTPGGAGGDDDVHDEGSF